MFARRVGNALQAFSCVPRVAPIMDMDSCFVEILVWVDSCVQFIDVETLVFKVNGVQEPCNDLLPLTVQAVESWVEINHCVTAVKSPPTGKHQKWKNIRSSHLRVIFESDIKAKGKQLAISIFLTCV